MNSAYAEEDCNEMYYFNAMHNNVCYQTEFEALIYNYPNASFFEVPYYSAPYYSVNCTDYNIGASVELPTTCDNVWFYADDDFIYSANAKGESTIYSMYSSAGNSSRYDNIHTNSCMIRIGYANNITYHGSHTTA